MQRWIAVAVALLAMVAWPAHAGDARGTVAYKGRTADVKFAYLVKGPDAMSKQPIRRIILSSKDLSAKIAACKTMSCTDGDLDEGLSINLEGGSRFNYWMVMNGQKIQFSGTEPTSSLVTKTDDAKKIAGKVSFDKTSIGGPKVDVEFDATMVKEVSAP